MNRAMRWVLGAVCSLGVILAIAVTATVGWRPFFGPRTRSVTNRHFDATPDRLARGAYLSRAVLGCLDCHTDHNWSAPGGPILSGREGSGGLFPAEGLPGRIVASNITSDRETGIGDWSDDELARAIREGVGRDGRALFPLMPYQNFRRLPDEDLAAVVVYIRSLPPIHSPLPQTEIAFPVKYLIRSVPQPIPAPVSAPDLSSAEKRGEFLATVASCADCHTPVVHGQPDLSMAFAGGQVFKGPWGQVVSANITPHKTGIAYYNEKLFIEAMRTGSVMGRPLNPLMPWFAYKDMTDDDLKAIFAYLRTVEPVENNVRSKQAAE